MKQPSKDWLQFLKANAIILIIVTTATWLRIWQLDTHGILIKEAGQTLVTAHAAISNHDLPLLGIPSGIPGIHQGLLTIWLQMLVITTAGINSYAQLLSFALIAIAAVIGLYEFACIYISKKHGLVAALLIAASPLAVAVSRMPTHPSLLSLVMMAFLFSLMLLWHEKKFSFFWMSLSLALVVQLEISLVTFVVLPVVVMWQQKLLISKTTISHLLAGLGVGWLPSIIFELTHGLSHTRYFFGWLAHSMTQYPQINLDFSYFLTLVGRIFSTDYVVVTIPIAFVIIVGFYLAFVTFKKKTLPPAILITDLALLILLVSYFFISNPSLSYWVPFFILLPIHLAFTIFSLPKMMRNFLVAVFVALTVFNTSAILQHNFFVSNQHAFSFGPSIKEMQSIINFLQTKSSGNYDLATFDSSENQLPNWFDSYRWIAFERTSSLPNPSGKTFYIEIKKTAPNSTPYIFRDFDVLRVYWLP